MKFRIASVLIAATACIVALPAAHALDNGVARTPPMGWNSWNKFACKGLNEQVVRATADAIATNGMKDAGYVYVNLDDCWQSGRDANGNIIVDQEKFPSGIRALADYVHSKGLKFGVYTDVGAKTCAGRPGSIGHEYQDARQYAEWGVDYLKEDWCNTLPGQNAESSYTLMRDALRHGPSHRLQPLRVGLEQALAVGWPHRQFMARHRRYPGLLGLQETLGRQRRGPDHRSDGRARHRELRRSRALERSRHA